jgi:RNA polymerase sigma factor (sigma-70 family)
LAAVPNVGRATRVESQVAPEATATQDLYERYSAQLLGYCFHKLGSREEAEDAVQQTFLNAFRGLKRGIVPEAESAWLFKIAENVCLTRRRSSFRRGRVETPGDIQALQEYVAAPTRMGTDELIQLQKALVGMPATQRKAILLREWQGLSYREIADEMGLSQAAVETLIFRARRSLAEGLERPEERTTLLARLRHGLDFASIAGGLKALLAGSIATKAVATTAAAVTVAAAVVAAAPEERGQEAPRAALERASAAPASAPGATVSATARARADARRAAAAARRDTPRAGTTPKASTAVAAPEPVAETAADTAADTPAVVHPTHPEPATPAHPSTGGTEHERSTGNGNGTGSGAADARGKSAAKPTPPSASKGDPETAKAKGPEAKPEAAESGPQSPPELPPTAQADAGQQGEGQPDKPEASEKLEKPERAEPEPEPQGLAKGKA